MMDEIYSTIPWRVSVAMSSINQQVRHNAIRYRRKIHPGRDHRTYRKKLVSDLSGNVFSRTRCSLFQDQSSWQETLEARCPSRGCEIITTTLSTNANHQSLFQTIWWLLTGPRFWGKWIARGTGLNKGTVRWCHCQAHHFASLIFTVTRKKRTRLNSDNNMEWVATNAHQNIAIASLGKVRSANEGMRLACT